MSIKVERSSYEGVVVKAGAELKALVPGEETPTGNGMGRRELTIPVEADEIVEP